MIGAHTLAVQVYCRQARRQGIRLFLVILPGTRGLVLIERVRQWPEILQPLSVG